MRTLPLVAALAVFVVLGGCGGASIEDVCQRACECEGTCATQQAECEANGKAYAELADQLGCSDAWDDYVACLDDGLTCTDGKADVSSCDAKETAFESDCGSAIN